MIRKASTRCDDICDWSLDTKKPKLDNAEAINKPHNCSNLVKENNSPLANSQSERDHYEVEYLDTPVKLDNDYREYRVIKLKNGLTALLISDNNKNVTNSDNEKKKFDKYNTNSQKETGIKAESRDVINNGSSDELRFAYCSLCINVGSFSDPPNIQGLAHLLEHMVSMGCKKYPLENDYDAFIQKRWGTCNAFTESEKTTYSFDIPEKYLLDALDRFANLFINPLITKNAIIRECQAVESEFKMAQQLDTSRKMQLKHSFMRENHPASKFAWGNLSTLQDNINVHELHLELHEFQKRHYSAHRMTLAVQAGATLDQLEKYVIDCFSNIPVNYLPPDDFSRFVGTDSFDTLKFRRIYNVKTVKDISEIDLNWAMPSMQHLYKSKPWDYVSYLLSRTGEGSLSYYLQKKMWCLDINNGSDESFENSSLYYLFNICLVLTDEGYNNLHEILKIIFSYIQLLRRECSKKMIFDNIKQIREKNFRSTFKDDNDNFIENMSQNMQHYSPVDYLNGYDLFLEYNPESIQSCVDILCPENVNIIVSSKKFNDKELDKVEPWFRTKYSTREIPKEWIACWKQVEPISEFHLSVKQNNSKHCTDETDDYLYEKSYPDKIDYVNGMELWCKKLQGNHVSDFSIYLHLISPLSDKSSFDSAMMNLFVVMLNHLTSEYLTEKSQINLSFKGIVIESVGCDKSSSISQISKILTDLKNCHKLITENLFNLAKREALKMYYNNFIDPCKLNFEVWLSMTASIFWLSNEKYEALSSVTYNQFINYTQDLTKQFFVQCLIKGSINNDETLKGVYKAIRLLVQRFSLLNDCPRIEIFKFAPGEKCCQIKNFNHADVNSVITNYYQIDTVSVRLFVIFQLISAMMDEPLFHHLRTQEQLGYKITCGERYSCGVICLAVSIVTQADKFTGEYIDERITNFLNCFKNTLKDMSYEDLDLIKENYIKLKYRCESEDTNSTDSSWAEILAGQYVFNRSDEEIKIVQSITIDDIYQYFIKYMIVGPNCRKLSVQIVGMSDSINTNNDETDNLENEKYSLIFSSEVTDEKKRNSGYYINDIRFYNHQLDVYS